MGKLEVYFENRLRDLSNEPSWSSFGHREGLQKLVAKQVIFSVLALRVCTSTAPLYLGAASLLGVIAKDILKP